MKQKYTSYAIEYVDTQTGEIVTPEIQKEFSFLAASKDELYNVFLDFIGPILGVKQASLKNVLVYLCSHADQYDGKVIVSAQVREEIRTKYNMKDSNLSRSIRTLKELNIIKGDKGTYYICKQLLWGNKIGNIKNKFPEPQEFSIIYDLVSDFQES